jgi:hypothetical protein
MILHAGVILVYPNWLYFFIGRNYDKLADPDFAEKFENAYENINKEKSPYAIWWHILFLLRRFLMAFICVVLIDYPAF